jgi:hypothetical protein
MIITMVEFCMNGVDALGFTTRELVSFVYMFICSLKCLISVKLISTVTANCPGKRMLFLIWFFTDCLNCIVEFMNFDECVGNSEFINYFELGR